VDVRPEAQQAFNDEVAHRSRNLAYTGGCTSWYLVNGRNTNNWIGYMSELIMRSGLASGQLVELLSDFTDPVRHPIYAVYQADRLRPQRIAVVLEFLKEIFGPEQTGAGLPER
jgi:DNA-binding transcriptional LysR family regulator